MSKSAKKAAKPAKKEAARPATVRKAPAVPADPKPPEPVANPKVVGRNGRTLEVILFKGKGFDPNGPQATVYVEGETGSDTFSATKAKGRFAKKPDGTVVYSHEGFAGTGITDLTPVDIVELLS